MPKIIKNLESKLIAEAQKQILAQGYGAVTIRSVANACGVGVGTVYNYFSSKDEIVISFIAAAWTECMNTINAVAKYATTYEAVIHCIYDQIYTFGKERDYIFLNTMAANSVDGAIYRHMWYLSSQLAEPLRKFCKNDGEAQIIAEALLTWIRTGKSYEEVIGNIVKLF